VAGHCAPIVKMRVLADVESDFLTSVPPDSKVAVGTCSTVPRSRFATCSSRDGAVNWTPCSPGAGVARCRPLPRALRTEQRTYKPWPQSARRPVWLFVRRSRSGRTDLGLQNSFFADRKTDSQSVGFSPNGTHLGLAKLHVTHSKDETGPASGP
jgi:hypothetical protein